MILQVCFCGGLSSSIWLEISEVEWAASTTGISYVFIIISDSCTSGIELILYKNRGKSRCRRRCRFAVRRLFIWRCWCWFCFCGGSFLVWGGGHNWSAESSELVYTNASNSDQKLHEIGWFGQEIWLWLRIRAEFRCRSQKRQNFGPSHAETQMGVVVQGLALKILNVQDNHATPQSPLD